MAPDGKPKDTQKNILGAVSNNLYILPPFNFKKQLNYEHEKNYFTGSPLVSCFIL